MLRFLKILEDSADSAEIIAKFLSLQLNESNHRYHSKQKKRENLI